MVCFQEVHQSKTVNDGKRPLFKLSPTPAWRVINVFTYEYILIELVVAEPRVATSTKNGSIAQAERARQRRSNMLRHCAITQNFAQMGCVNPLLHPELHAALLFMKEQGMRGFLQIARITIDSDLAVMPTVPFMDHCCTSDSVENVMGAQTCMSGGNTL